MAGNIIEQGQGQLVPTTSKAHAKSQTFIIDPVYSATAKVPSRSNTATCAATGTCCTTAKADGWVWVYGDGEMESYRLSVLFRRAQDAKINVWYPSKFHIAKRRAFFWISTADVVAASISSSGDEYLRFSSNGTAKVFLVDNGGNGGSDLRERLAYMCQTGRTLTRDDIHSVKFEATTMAIKIEVETVLERNNEDGDGDDDGIDQPPCLWTPIRCGWKWSSDGGATTDPSNTIWLQCQSFPAEPGATTYPHLAEDPEVLIEPKSTIEAQGGRPIVYDFGVDILGRLVIECNVGGQNRSISPKLFVGESIAEAMDPSYQEQSTELVLLESNNNSTQQSQTTIRVEKWISAHLVAFQFACVIVPDSISVSLSCRATFHPAQYKGAFACSNDKLTKIWMHSAYTLRACLHDFILDGIKRDRLPWAGDLAISLLSNAFTFADADIIEKSLTVLGRAGIAEKDINSFVDYSIWWIICNDLYQLYFGDMTFLRREWPRIRQAVVCLLARCDVTGLLVVKKDKDMVFIDWVEIEKFTALQILWWWALGCSASIARRIGSDECVKEWSIRQVKVGERLRALCWDDIAGLWIAAPDCPGDYSRHANVLAAVAGLNKEHELDKIARALGESEHEMADVKTPYMKIFECLALTRLDHAPLGLEEMTRYWGGMLDAGASTFWEAYNPNDSDESYTAFYERPYGKSLCHAWSSGPCCYIPETIFGVKPLSDRWETWVCRPKLPLHLKWACIAVPTPQGCIEIELSAKLAKISIPQNSKMELNGDIYAGPQQLSLSLQQATVIDEKIVKELSRPYRGWHYYREHVIPAKPNIKEYENVEMTDVPTVYQLPGVANRNTWYMSFIGFDGSGYQSFVAESRDLVKWTNKRLAFGYGEEGEFDYGGRVLGAYLYEDYEIKAPRVLKRRDGKFWGLYGAYRKRGSYEIDPGYEGVCCSDDGLIWRRAADKYILSVHDDGCKEWERGSIYQPWLVQDGDKFYNFYNAKKMPEWKEQLGLATSTDLLCWDRYKDNPVLRVRSGGFDSDFVADAKVFRDRDHWCMFYFGVGYGKAHIMMAFSKDLHHWNADPNPIYKAGQHPDGLDKQHAHKISLVYNSANETFYMYFCAVGEAGRGIGLITSKKLAQD